MCGHGPGRLIHIQDIRDAALRLDGVALHTPLIEIDALNAIAGGRILIKPECLQRTGSFKIRGAYNLISQLTDAQKKNGVVAFSSGNHAQGVAAAGTLLNVSTTIVMPDDAPAIKLENTRALGGNVVTYDRETGDREEIASRIADEEGRVIAPSYDHEAIVAGQGTIGLEIADDCKAANVSPTQLVICCGGGGLASGTGIALRESFPDVGIVVVEPDAFDDVRRSLLSGEREGNAAGARSICDAIQTPSPGIIPFEILCALHAEGVTVSDADVCRAMRFAFEHLKLVVEPGGAVALAAVLSGAVETKDRLTVVVLSGGNVDPDMFNACLGDGAEAAVV